MLRAGGSVHALPDGWGGGRGDKRDYGGTMVGQGGRAVVLKKAYVKLFIQSFDIRIYI